MVEGLELRPNSLFAILPPTPPFMDQGSSVQALADSRIMDGQTYRRQRTARNDRLVPARLEMARLLDTELVRTLRGGGEGGGRERSGVTRS